MSQTTQQLKKSIKQMEGQLGSVLSSAVHCPPLAILIIPIGVPIIGICWITENVILGFSLVWDELTSLNNQEVR